jgi:hypothetical protein
MASISTEYWISLVFFFIVVFFLFIYFSKKWKSLNLREGLDSMPSCTNARGSCAKDFNNKIVSAINVKTDALNISAYRADYENIIINYETMYDQACLDLLLSIENPLDDTSDAIVEKINKYQEFKRNLNDIMKFVDKT